MAKYTTPVGSCLCHYNVIVVVFGIVRSVTKTFLFEHIHLEKLLMFGIFNFNLPKLRKILTLCITFVSDGYGGEGVRWTTTTRRSKSRMFCCEAAEEED